MYIVHGVAFFSGCNMTSLSELCALRENTRHRPCRRGRDDRGVIFIAQIVEDQLKHGIGS